MIELCREAGLPAPAFEQRGDSFVVTLWRDWLTEETLAGLCLNARQKQAVSYVKQKGKITNSIYQVEFKTSKRTASRELEGMRKNGILERVGTTGKGLYYKLGKGATKGPNGPDAFTP